MSSRGAADAALAAALRRLREERGMSREAVALQAGVATGTLARIELGRAGPAWATVRRLALALGVTLVDVARAAEEPARVGRGEAPPSATIHRRAS